MTWIARIVAICSSVSLCARPRCVVFRGVSRHASANLQIPLRVERGVARLLAHATDFARVVFATLRIGSVGYSGRQSSSVLPQPMLFFCPALATSCKRGALPSACNWAPPVSRHELTAAALTAVSLPLPHSCSAALLSPAPSSWGELFLSGTCDASSLMVCCIQRTTTTLKVHLLLPSPWASILYSP